MTMKDSIVVSFARERRQSRVTNVQDLINTLSLWDIFIVELSHHPGLWKRSKPS